MCKNNFLVLGSETIMFVKRKDKIIKVLIDTDSLELIRSIGSWHAIQDKTLHNNSYYIANRYNNKTKGKGVIKLHRLLTDCPRDMVVDHIDRDPLNNKLSNLKVCTEFENHQNQSRRNDIIGVYYRARDNRWYANISFRTKRITRVFKTKEEAVAWRQAQEEVVRRGEEIA